jgi:hypothetical protein
MAKRISSMTPAVIHNLRPDTCDECARRPESTVRKAILARPRRVSTTDISSAARIG